MGLWKSAKEYGPAFTVYYTLVWASTGLGIYFLIERSNPTAVLDAVERWGLQGSVGALLDRIGPEYANVAVAIAVNEIIEPIRLPLGVLAFFPIYRNIISKFLRRGPK